MYTIQQLKPKVYFKVINELIDYFGGDEDFVLELCKSLNFKFTKSGQLIREKNEPYSDFNKK